MEWNELPEFAFVYPSTCCGKEHSVKTARFNMRLEFPANFMLVAAINPCLFRPQLNIHEA